jgi:non-heme chloroperoxidase
VTEDNGKIDAPLVVKRTTSEDGTELAYYVVGRGPRTWLMPPAMGAPLLSMKYVLERFADEYTIISWDQRGFYGSDAPRDPDAMGIDDQLRDMHAVILAEGLERFVLGGWSMSVQLSLEYYHRRPSDVRALVLINGPYERPAAAIVPLAGADPLALGALRLGARASPVLNALSRRILGARGMATVLHRAGLLASNPAFFESVMGEFSRVDWRRYFTMTRMMHTHSAAAYLAEVRVPTLITAGTRDLLTPPRIAESMHRAIAGSELFVVPGATHYIVVEFPELLTDRIAAFLRRVEQGGRG